MTKILSEILAAVNNNLAESNIGRKGKNERPRGADPEPTLLLVGRGPASSGETEPRGVPSNGWCRSFSGCEISLTQLFSEEKRSC